MNAHATMRGTLPDHRSFDTVEVRWVRHWNEHLFSFAVARPAGFRFRSGEFVMIGLPSGDRPVMRAYSIASPAWSDELEFLSIKVPDGALTARLQEMRPGDALYLARKPTGTLVLDALLGGRRLFLLGTGTGLAPFLSLARDPDAYDRFGQVVVAHSVRRVGDLAYHDEQAARWEADPLVGDAALLQFGYVPTVTREPFHTTGRLDALIADGRLFAPPLLGPRSFDPAHDRVMLCGSTGMIRETAARLDALGFTEGSNAQPGSYVIERAFVG